jgi:hypothetical protein
MRESLRRHHSGGVADPFLPQGAVAVDTVVLPLHPDLLPIRAGSVPQTWFLAREHAYRVEIDEVSAVLSRRMGSRSPRKIGKRFNNRMICHEI